MQDPSLQEKVEDLSNFASACKFGMMTTKDSSTGLLVSRCMAVAAKEAGGLDLIFRMCCPQSISGTTKVLTRGLHRHQHRKRKDRRSGSRQ